MADSKVTFGGDWTNKKLDILGDYLQAYAIALKNQSFKRIYIDAFAGSGYRARKNTNEDDRDQLSIPVFEDDEREQFLAGSASIALQIEPPFDQYIFIEKNEDRCRELEKLCDTFPDKNIVIENEDANTYLHKLCYNTNKNFWKQHRAVAFLDPYGMQVGWQTIEAIAQTKAIDMWYLFPLGIAVNRLLKRDGQISEAICHCLDRLFGESDWYNAFYQSFETQTLFGVETGIDKTASFQKIEAYLKKRLKTIFLGVASNPRPLCNSKNNPLYLFCFASGNPKGYKLALKISQHILGKM